MPYRERRRHGGTWPCLRRCQNSPHLGDRLQKIVDAFRPSVLIPWRQVDALKLPEPKRRLDRIESGRNETASVAAFRSFILNPRGGDRGGTPQHHDDLGILQLAVDLLAEVRSAVHMTVP